MTKYAYTNMTKYAYTNMTKYAYPCRVAAYTNDEICECVCVCVYLNIRTYTHENGAREVQAVYTNTNIFVMCVYMCTREYT